MARASTVQNTNREERALAAQKTRERLLAEVAAKCEEEVRKAKKRAEENKERKAAESLRMKEEMEEKFAEAEKRRLLFKRNMTKRPRGSSLPSVEEKKVVAVKSALKQMSQASAAKVVQRAWRNSRQRRAANHFLSLSMSADQIRKMEFEDISALLARDDVLAATTKMLRVTGVYDAESGATEERTTVREFLSAYLILAHPSQVFSGNGEQEQEQDLISKSQDLLLAFEQVLSKHAASGFSVAPLSTELQAWTESYSVYLSAFHAWKSQDSSTLVEIMLAQFVELDQIWQSVKTAQAGHVADDYHQGIRQNQIMLLARLKRLAGPEKAMVLVRNALRAAAKRRKRALAPEARIPRVTANMTPTDVETASSRSAVPFVLSEAQRPTTPESERDQLRLHRRLARTLTTLPENRVLIHELLVNKEYKIEQEPFTESRKAVMDRMCDTMRTDVEAGFGARWTVAMAAVIRDKLLYCLTPGNSMYVLISEVLDPAIIDSQCQAGTFSYDTFFDFMTMVLGKLVAPARDEQVKEFAQDKESDAIGKLSKLMSIIDLLSLDHTNFTLSMLAPRLAEEGPGYEQRAFARDLEAGKTTLESTRRFWNDANMTLVEDMRRRDPESINPNPQPHASRIYVHALLDLIFHNGAFQEANLPETLKLDHERLLGLHARVLKATAIASILLSAKNLLKRDVRSQWKQEADRILANPDFAQIKEERILQILESGHPMPAATKAQLASSISRVLAPAIAAATRLAEFKASKADVSSAPSSPILETPPSLPTATKFTDPVSKLLLSRLRAHVTARLNATSASERVRATATAASSLAAAGMPELVGEIGGIVGLIERVRSVDWSCHGNVYAGIMEES